MNRLYRRPGLGVDLAKLPICRTTTPHFAFIRLLESPSLELLISIEPFALFFTKNYTTDRI